MAVFNEPAQWDHTLGNNADASNLPDDSAATAGTASLQKLFQIINATPLEAGGIAPDREDVNALFKYLGDQIFYTQNGGIPSYNAAYDYIPGRVVLYTDNNIYKCIQANGASSTVVAPGTDDAYWKQLDAENNNTSLIPNQIIQSPVPLTDANLHLLDGALLSGDGAYADYVAMMGELYNADPTATCWTTESDWQTSVTTYGECGKFVYDSVNNTLRLPKLSSFVQATSTANELGSLVEAGAPNITGYFSINKTGPDDAPNPDACSGSFYNDGDALYNAGTDAAGSRRAPQIAFSASRSSSVYGNSSTIQPQAIKYYFYIVVGTLSKTDILIDIDNVLTDLNGKADKDFSNVTPNQAFKNTSIAWDKPDFSARVSYTISNTSNYQFTMSDNGFLAFTFYNTTTSQTAYLKVNSVDVCIGGSFNNSHGDTFTGVVPVSKNDVVDFKTNSASSPLYGRLVFFPCKGA